MKRIIFFIAAVIFLGSCEEKDVSLYPSFKESTTITVNEEGSFKDNGTISASQIISTINDLELDETGEIEAVTVEGIWLEVEPLSANTAESVELDILVSVWAGGFKYLLEDFEMDIPDKKTVINLPNYLKKAGVQEIKGQLSAIVVDRLLNNDIYFEFEGAAIPKGSVINLSIKVYVKGAVVFTQTVDLI